MNQKIVALLLSICLVMLAVFAVPMTASAAEVDETGLWEFTQETGMATITKYKGDAADVVVPDSFGDYLVVAIGDNAFAECQKLESVTFPKTLNSIGSKAFSGCWRLTSVTLPENLTSLGYRAFEKCAFLSEIIVQSKNLTLSGNYAGTCQPFYNAGSRTDGITVTFAEGCQVVPAKMFSEDGSSLVKAIFSNTVTSIGDKAFYQCSNLQNVTLPESLTSIGQYAFAGCTAFTSVTLPGKLETLGERSFDGTTKLSEIIVKAVALKNITDSYGANGQPFYGAGTGTDGITVTFAEGCTKVPGSMFYTRDNGVAPNLKKVVMSDTVKEIGVNAFASCVYLENVQMGNGVSIIGESAFYNCAKLTRLDLSDNLITISKSAFSRCSALNNIVFPDTLTSIASYAFNECHAFTNVTLPAKLTTLGERSFNNCTGLTEIVVKSTLLKDITNSYGTNGQPFYNAGTAADGITVTFAEGCTRIPNNLFWKHQEGVAPNVTKVVMPDTVTEIGGSAFSGCAYLTEVVSSKNLSTIGKSAFYNCAKLSSFEFGELVTLIGEYAFYGCSALDNVTFPNALREIGDYAFGECQSFTSVVLPKKLSVLGQRAFNNCVNITEIRIKSESMKDVVSNYDAYGQPFYCAGTATSGITVTFERGCRRIPGYIFDAHDGGSVAANIVEVNVAAGVREIGKYAFANCTALRKITFKGRACTFANDAVFAGVEANAYHPGWPEEARLNYGGEITWIGYELPIIRLGGQTRFDTAIKVADEMKEQLGVTKFESIIIASGMNFADALSGSYLATVKNAPILLTWKGDPRFDYLNNQVADYVKENLVDGGTVYILGGSSAVPESVDALLSGIQVIRLAGSNRFETNLAILREAGVGDKEILVCTGTNFADSLSGSATGLPILLVFNESGKLYDSQKEYLSQLQGNALCVVGGESAISFKLESALGSYGRVRRLAGTNRFETSVKLAEEYFDAPNSVVLAYAWNYPDGLCGGALAYSVDAPLILTMNKYEDVASEYAQGQDINSGFVLGSSELISDNTVRTIFSLKADHQITAK